MRLTPFLFVLAACGPSAKPFLGSWSGPVGFDREYDDGTLELTIEHGERGEQVDAWGTMTLDVRRKLQVDHALDCVGSMGKGWLYEDAYLQLDDVGEDMDTAVIALWCTTDGADVVLLAAMQDTRLVGYAAPAVDESGSANPCALWFGSCSTYIEDDDAALSEGLFEAAVDEAEYEGALELLRQ